MKPAYGLAAKQQRVAELAGRITSWEQFEMILAATRPEYRDAVRAQIEPHLSQAVKSDRDLTLAFRRATLDAPHG